MSVSKKLNKFESNWIPALIRYLYSGKIQGLFEQALPYLEEDSMFDFSANRTNEISCSIEDQDIYEVAIKAASGRLFTYCSCSVELDCKHSLALALTVVWLAQKRGYEFPGSIKETYAQAFDKLNDVAPEIDELDAILSRPVQRRVEAILPERWWEPLTADTPWAKQELVYKSVIAKMIPAMAFWEFNDILSDLRDYKNPIKRLRSLVARTALYLKSHSYKKSRPVPSENEFLAFLASPAAAEMEDKYDRLNAERNFISWLKSQSEQEEQALLADQMEVAWLLKLVQPGLYCPYFQVYATAGNRGLMARKPTGILKIAQEVIEHKKDFGVQYNEFCSWIVDTQIGYYNQDLGINEADQTQILVSNMLEWLTTWPNLVKWKDGGLVKLAGWSAEITMSPGASGDAQWVIAVPSHDNNAAFDLAINDAVIVCDAPLSQTKYNKRPCQAFLRLEDTLVRLETHGITFSTLEAICKLGKVPVEALKGTLEGQTLFRILSRGSNPAALSQWSRQIPVSAEVRLAINSDNELQINARALARTADDPSFFWKPGPGWQPLPLGAEVTAGTISLPDEQSETSSSEVPGNKILRNAEALSNPEESRPVKGSDTSNKKFLHTAPRQEDVQDLEQWLKGVLAILANASISSDKMGIKGSIKQSNFLPRWFQRPPNVDYFGNSDFQKLVTVRPGPKLSVKAEASGMDWLTVSVSVENEISQTSLPELSKILAANSSAYVRLPGGIYRRADLEAYQDDLNDLNALGLSVQSDEQRLHALHLAGAPTGIMARLEESGATMAALAEDARVVLRNFKGIPDAPVPADVANFLRPYQHSGVNFLYWAALNFGGALLSDDMGLGKTLQMLATITALRQNSNGPGPGPSLVVCPASVAHNWQREAHRFAPGLNVLVLESGAGRRKHLNELAKYDLVIMNFALLRRDIESLQKTSWFIIVVDEAQAIKNAASESSRNIKQLDAMYRFALTGTPIENRISDLYSIVDFALPGYLGEMDVATDSTDPQSTARASQLLRSKLRPMLIRRMKTEVAPELPDRVETRIDCEMGAPQKKLYAAEVKRARAMLEGMDDSALQGKHRIEMLAALMRLRQICCDPLLAGHPEISSGKTDELLELVPSLLEAGHKVLIFSQFVKMLNHLEEQLTQKDIRTYKLTGATKNRQVLVDQFEGDKTPAAFLISLKAGGTGLNLVSASHVILFDPWWNPSVEAQAIDRTHRIGQDKTVVAYRLVALGTIEERILELQEKKRALVRNILEEDSFNRTLTNEDFKFLLD